MAAMASNVGSSDAAQAESVSSFRSVISDGVHSDSDLEAGPESVIVHLLCATRLPRLEQLNRSSISPYCTMIVIDHTGKEAGTRAVWAPRFNTKEPVWNCAHDMKLPKMPYHDLKRSLLHVELWDHDGLLPPNLIGQVRCTQSGFLLLSWPDAPLAPRPHAVEQRTPTG